MNQPHINKAQLAGVALAALVLAGCQATTQRPAAAIQQPTYQSADNYPSYYPTPAAAVADIQPAAGPAPMAQPMPYIPGASVSQMAALEGTLTKVDERLQRVEKAMLRLDRRMQLVERNELNRMTGDSGPAPKRTSAVAPDGFGPVPVSAQGGAQGGYSEGFQPVSTAITSGLQAAPSRAALDEQTGFQLASLATTAPQAGTAAMASLADDKPGDSRPSADSDLAIWTVKFESANVWPDRNQLPAGRDVIMALRSGTPVTVFARGKQPNAVLFRDRVKAISRYLGKVSGQDSIPIAALPGAHLDDKTIEIFATY